MPTVIKLGNKAPVEIYREPVDAELGKDALAELAEARGVTTTLRTDGGGAAPKDLLIARLEGANLRRRLEGQREAVIVLPEDALADPRAAFAELALAWSNLSDEAPAWIECSDERIAELAAIALGGKIGRPRGWAGIPIDAGADPRRSLRDERGSALLALLAPWLALPLLRTAAGRDFQSRVMGDTASNGTGLYAAASFIALTENATAPADGDTTLAGELTGEGLARAQATYSHGAGASNYALTKTFTMSSGTSRTIQKAGVFNAASAGTLVFETAVPNPPTLVPNDQLQITETVTI